MTDSPDKPAGRRRSRRRTARLEDIFRTLQMIAAAPAAGQVADQAKTRPETPGEGGAEPDASRADAAGEAPGGELFADAADVADAIAAAALVEAAGEEAEENLEAAAFAPHWQGPLTGFEFAVEAAHFGIVLNYAIPTEEPILLRVGFTDRDRLMRHADDADLALAVAMDPDGVPDEVILANAGSLAYQRAFFENVARQVDPGAAATSGSFTFMPALERERCLAGLAKKQATVRTIAKRIDTRMRAVLPPALMTLIDEAPENGMPA